MRWRVWGIKKRQVFFSLNFGQTVKAVVMEDNTLPENHLRVTITQPHHMNMDPTTKNKRKKTKNNCREMRPRYIYPCLIQKPTPLKQTGQNRPGRKCKTHPKLHTKKNRAHEYTCQQERHAKNKSKIVRKIEAVHG
jgi:hypothetical protein